ncbi:MAG TPA: efflux RND transporter periplasmic adaptor subunit [Bryobacteraceae bacterium]|nr:efflux RND transporter periplasmic adaptor subunit [Bryobacteraceae bacterium]
MRNADTIPTRRKRLILLTFAAGAVAGVLGSLVIELIGHASRSAEGRAASAEATKEAAPSSVVRLELAAMRNIALTVVPAQMRTVRQAVRATGSIGPNESRLAHIRPLARGRVERVYVRLGDRVRAGQPLLEYDNVELGELIGGYLSAVAGLEKARAEAEVARRSLERARSLVELGAVARAEFERRDAEYQNALASINSQRAEIAKVEEKLHRFGLSDAEIRKLGPQANVEAQVAYHREASHNAMTAPFSGIVIKYNVAEGEVIGPENELLTLADLSTVWVLADVYEKDIALIRQGQEARIMADAYPGQVFRGSITYVSDMLDPKTRTARVRCEVPNPDGRLKLDMFVSVELPTPVGRQALMVPSSAIQQIDDQPVVFVKTGETQFERRNVRLGSNSDGWVEVTSGVRQGEPVVTDGSFHLKSVLLRERIGGEE